MKPLILNSFPHLSQSKLTLAPDQSIGIILLEDGTTIIGTGMGARKTEIGELCFNTSITGYQEILTDPSYARQIINFTFPHIGIVGTNSEDRESRRSFATGCIFAAQSSHFSNWRAQKSLNEWLIKENLVAVADVDSRYITHYIRQGKAVKALIGNMMPTEINASQLLTQLRDWPDIDAIDLALEVTCKEKYEWTEGSGNWDDNRNQVRFQSYHVVAVDYGIKHNILRCLVDHGCHVTVVPCQTSAEDILKLKPDGIFLSNGPGNPIVTGRYVVPILQKLINSGLPIFGICLGHQLLAIAVNGKTQKMPTGHRGANHPVQNLSNGKVEITSQNHGFAVIAETLPSYVKITHRSLFDQSVEGMRFENRPIFSVQYHPESSPGPHDSRYLFSQFIELMHQYRQLKQR